MGLNQWRLHWLTLPQNLIGLPQLPVLAFKLFDTRNLSSGRSRPFADIALDLSHPDAKAVWRAAQFTRDRTQRRSLALIIIAVFHRQPNRALTELRGIRLRGLLLLCLFHNGQFSESFALRQTRRGSERQKVAGVQAETPVIEPVPDPETGHVVSPVIAAALCIKLKETLTPDQARKTDALKAGSPAFVVTRSLAMGFNGILRGRNADALPNWIDDAIETELAPIVRFARTLNRDIDAVWNAIGMPWSNGQAEGQINLLKTMNRSMYGRAGPALLRARMLPFRHTL